MQDLGALSNATWEGLALDGQHQQGALSIALGQMRVNIDASDIIATCAFVVCSVWFVYSHFIAPASPPDAPVIGWRKSYEPRFVANLRFLLHPKGIIDEGYRKFASVPFWFARNDADMIVLPNKHVNEIQRLDPSIANPTAAHVHNLLGHITGTDLILKSNLHFRVIQTRLNPSLAIVAPALHDELIAACADHMPHCTDWTAIHPYHTVLHLVARMSARAFVGFPHCRNEQWLKISTQFTENVFITLVALRTFPPWTHRALSMLLPSFWQNKSYIRRAQKILGPDIKRMQDKLRRGEKLQEDNMLVWLVENATTDVDNDPNHIAHLALILSLASIHTTQMNAVHCLNDLAAHPEFFEPLRAEILEATKGGGWQKSNFSKLRKLDSFMKECQRFNPPSLLSYHRIMQQSHVLADGTTLPQGAHICMPVSHIQNDSSVTPRPAEFDPFRYERLRQDPGQGILHQFATTTPQSLNFGHGRYACPGRFFAALEIKNVLVQLIMNYDFKLPDGQGRPKNKTAYEFIFPDPNSELLFKRRDMDKFSIVCD